MFTGSQTIPSPIRQDRVPHPKKLQYANDQNHQSEQPDQYEEFHIVSSLWRVDFFLSYCLETPSVDLFPMFDRDHIAANSPFVTTGWDSRQLKQGGPA